MNFETPTGHVVRLDDDVILPGKLSLQSSGYVQLTGVVKGRSVLIHRWLMGLEIGDPREVDHRNFDRLDNRRCNLRVATKTENRQHTKTGGIGAYRLPSGRWHARVYFNRKATYHGVHRTREEALAAAETARLAVAQ